MARGYQTAGAEGLLASCRDRGRFPFQESFQQPDRKSVARAVFSRVGENLVSPHPKAIGQCAQKELGQYQRCEKVA